MNMRQPATCHACPSGTHPSSGYTKNTRRQEARPRKKGCAKAHRQLIVPPTTRMLHGGERWGLALVRAADSCTAAKAAGSWQSGRPACLTARCCRCMCHCRWRALLQAAVPAAAAAADPQCHQQHHRQQQQQEALVAVQLCQAPTCGAPRGHLCHRHHHVYRRAAAAVT